MLDFLVSSQISETLTLASSLTVIFSALFLGLIISLVYMYTNKEVGYGQAFSASLIMLPTIVAMIILLVGSNVARAFSLAGAFSLIKFRSAPGDSRDIANVFFAVAVGLFCGMGYIGYGLVFTIILSFVMILLSKLNYGRDKEIRMAMKIIIPEDMEYYGVFDKVFAQYCKKAKLVKVKTKEFGSLYELNYSIIFNNEEKIKECIDKIRIRNGNLRVEISTLLPKEEAF